MKKIRVGVLGAYRGTSMINYCKRASNAEVVAICDKSQETLDSQKENTKGLNIAFYDNFDDFMNYLLDDGWIELEENENVYYRKVDKKNEKQIYSVFRDDVVYVNSDITRALFNSLTNENYPTISISAYGMQRNSKIDAIDTVEDAWLLVNNQEN